MADRLHAGHRPRQRTVLLLALFSATACAKTVPAGDATGEAPGGAAGAARGAPAARQDGPHAAGAALRFMTFNVRWGTAPDGDDAWPNRRGLLLRTIEAFDPHVLGVQEALRFQLDELGAAMEDAREVGVGRDDGAEAGEYSAILYDHGRLDLLDHGTFWLSDTPDVPGSMTWGNRYPRLVTWARLRDRATGGAFFALNTHWDHESQNTRVRSARQIARWLADRGRDAPVVLMGDFNAGPSNPAFRALLEAEAFRLRDSWFVAHPAERPVGTYHAFTGDRSGDKIDAVLASPHWRVQSAEIVTFQEEGRYPSDHFPVTATLALTGSR